MASQLRIRRLVARLMVVVGVLPAMGLGAAVRTGQTSTAPSSTFSVGENKATAALSVATIRDVTAALVSKDMQGRGTGQPGADRAAKYIADRFTKLGLKPAGVGGYLQPIKFKTEQLLPDSSFEAGNAAFKYKQDFVVAPPRPDAPLRVSGDLVLVGYGVTSAELKRDDLAGVDVKNKIAVVLAGKPKNVDARVWSKEANLQAVISKLAAAGAVGVVSTYVPFRETAPYSIASVYLSRRRVSLPDAPEPSTKLPVLVVSDATAEKLLEGSGASYSQIKAQAEAGEFVSRPLSRRGSISVDLRRGDATSSNVAALLEGSDPKLKEEAVVLSAHYDAYGIDTDGTIYPGAADNAIGIAKLIAIAEALVRSGSRPRRSVLFLAVTGEEYGLLGSAYWAKHPTWPIDKIAADINYDGIGTDVWGSLGYVIDYGFKHSDLGDVLQGVLAAQGVKIIPDPAPQEGIFYRSDHYEFFKKGVPSLYLIGAPAGNVMAVMAKATKFLLNDYHMATDTVQPDWNWDGARGLAETGLVVCLRVADQDAMPSWKESSPYNRPRGTNLPPPPPQ